MPHIKITGLDTERVRILSRTVSKSLSEIIDCPIDWITFSIDTSSNGTIFCNGALAKDTVFIHVEWFDRGCEIKDSVAKIITDGILHTKDFISTEIECVDVIFVNLEKSDYYENGKHF